MTKKKRDVHTSMEVSKAPDLDYETIQKMRGFSEGEINVLKRFSNPAAIEETAERVIQVLQRGVNPIIEDNIKKRKGIKEKDRKIKNLLPQAKIGRKISDATSKGGYAKKEQYDETKQSLLQEMADKHWNMNPGLANRNVAIKISKEINIFIRKGELEEPLNRFYNSFRHPNFNTIRKLIKNPNKK